MKSIGALSRSPSPIRCSVNRHLAEFTPHGFDGRLVGSDLVAMAPQARSGNRRSLRDAHDFEREDTFQ
jgi:hypothetical protein